MTRTDRRTAAWPDFLRRLLLSASLAGSAALPVTTSPDETPPGDVAEAEPACNPVLPISTFG